MCGSYGKLVHFARTTPTNLCADPLRLFDEEVRLCFSSCLAVDVPDVQWQQAQLSPKFGGFGLRSLSLHSCAAFISSLTSSGLGSPENIHLQQAILHFNAQVSPQDMLKVETVLNVPPHQSALSQKIDTHIYQSHTALLCFSSYKAHLLSVSGPHAGSWISSIPSASLNLHLDSVKCQACSC